MTTTAPFKDNIKTVVTPRQCEIIVKLLTQLGYNAVTHNNLPYSEVDMYIYTNGRVTLHKPLPDSTIPEFKTMAQERVLSTLRLKTGEAKFFNYCLASDVKPYEILEIINDNKIIVSPMQYKCVDKDYEPQEGEYISQQGGIDGTVYWLITPNPEKYPVTITLRKDGRWYQAGTKAGRHECYFSPAVTPRYYYDYSF